MNWQDLMSYMQMPYFAVFLLTICRIKLSNYKQSQTRLFSIESNLTFLEMGEDSSASSVETMPCGIVAQNQEMYQWFLMNHFDLNALWFWNGHRILSWGASQLQTHGKGSGRHFSGGFFYYYYFSSGVTANSAITVSNISTPTQNESDLRHSVEL